MSRFTESLNLRANKDRRSAKKKSETEHETGGPVDDATNTGKKQLTEREKTIRALKRLLRKIAIIAVVLIILLTVVGGIAVCHDNSMFPSVKDGDLAITYKLGGYYNGDIVIYKVNGQRKFGRIVGIPGDTIDFNDDGTYTINGAVPYETIYFATRPQTGSTVRFPYTVKEGEYFIFNDMREDGNDSRVYGGITDVRGKVVLMLRRRGF